MKYCLCTVRPSGKWTSGQFTAGTPLCLIVTPVRHHYNDTWPTRSGMGIALCLVRTKNAVPDFASHTSIIGNIVDISLKSDFDVELRPFWIALFHRTGAHQCGTYCSPIAGCLAIPSPALAGRGEPRPAAAWNLSALTRRSDQQHRQQRRRSDRRQPRWRQRG